MKIQLTVLALALCSSSLLLAQTAIKLPTVTGPVAVTETSWPLMAANRMQEVVDLAAAGYVEEEYILTGTANLYERAADGSIDVKTADAPYGTRILVRRPADAADFSGNVIVELLIEARSYDWAFVWAMSHELIMQRGDVFVGVTHMPQNIDALKTFDPQRYAALSFANPNPAETCGPQNSTSPTEEGLHWDMLSQLGALLKSGPATSPLHGLDVQYVYMAGHHGHAATYANTFHNSTTLANGKPVYDGYLLPSSDVPMRLTRCGATLPAGDPRLIISKVNVPVIRVVPQGEVLGVLATRREDSDAADDRFRLYEVPGAPRMDRIYFQHIPVVDDQIKAGQPVTVGKWPYNYTCTPDINLLDYQAKRYVINGALANLDSWVRTGTPPPRAERIAVKNAGTPQAAFDTDEYGNAKGGVRLTYVEVPVATYSGNSPAPCGSIAMKTPFDWARLQTLYGTPAAYAAKVKASVQKLADQHWVTATDAARMQAELLNVNPPPAAGSN
jgi:hypothetical protein